MFIDYSYWNKTKRHVILMISFLNLKQIFHQPIRSMKRLMTSNYMNTRCPSWCDRILFNHSARRLLEAISTTKPPVYNVIGQHVPMGDHKVIYQTQKKCSAYSIVFNLISILAGIFVLPSNGTKYDYKRLSLLIK